MNPKIRVIVCGVGFGQFYLKALENLKENYELTGILSRGSEWSKKCADKYKVPLYLDVNELTKEMVDLVCVVVKSTIVGGEGSIIVEKLLEKGINVIQEHPIHEEDYIKFIKMAQKHKCIYRLNTFYPDLINVSSYINLSNGLRKYSNIKCINAECSVHVLFPLIDILGRVIGKLRPWKFEKVENTLINSPFSIVQGYIGDVPICINIQNEFEPEDPENSILLFHRIVVYTECGNLIMTGTNSNIIWEPSMNKKVGEDGFFHAEEDSEFLDLFIYEMENNSEGKTLRQMYLEVWPDSIKIFLNRFYEDYIHHINRNKEVQFLLGACQAWRDLGKCIGSTKMIGKYKKIPLRLENLNVKEELF